MKRREFLRRLGVGSLAAMGFSRFALAQARPVKLAALLPLTGPFAFAGNAGREGFVDGVDYVSGVRMLEARADRKWGREEAYQAYKARTPSLLLKKPA